MSKVINKSGLECTIFGLGLLAIAGYNYSKGPDTDIPMSIGKLVVDTYENKDVVSFNELEGLNVYLDYSYSDDKYDILKLFYSRDELIQWLKEEGH